MEEAIKSLKPGKAAGIDEIRPEMLKALGEGGMKWLTRVCRIVWKSGVAPEDWQTGVIVPIYKKGSEKECSNYRGITLLSLPSKVYAKVLLKRLKVVVDNEIQDEQCGFRAGRGTTDQLFILQQVVEKTWEYDRQAHMCFVDLEKAYDRVDSSKMWDVLREYGVANQLVRAIAALYAKSRSCVRVLGQKSRLFDIGAGLRQGCVISPLLFIIYMDRIAKRSLGSKGLRLGDVEISHLLFADDLVILAPSSTDLQAAVDSFANECEAVSMKINTSKTETMVISRTTEQCTVQVDGAALKQVEKFKYLGVEFASDGKWENEIDRRIASAGVSIQQLFRKCLSRSGISHQVKLAVYRTIFVPTLTYGHENWVMSERMKSRIQAAEMRVLRRIAGCRRIDKIENKVIRENLKVEPLLLQIEKSQMRWLGHVLRMGPERLVKKVWNARPTETRPKGRPRARWRDQALKVCQKANLTEWSEICTVAEDRHKWRGLVRES